MNWIEIKLLSLLLVPIVSMAQPSVQNDFKYHLNHIDICVDSVTFHSLLNNRFITDTFSSAKIFRDSTGTEILVRGQDHWLHFLPDKGFYKHRLGAAVLQHNSFVWKEIDIILEHLQSFTKDSLYNRPYRSGGENTDHIHIYENVANSLSLLKFIPQLQKFSKENYIGWGYTEADLANGISQKRDMQDYVGKETADKLFKNIQSIKVTISADELKRIPPLLKGYGYLRKGNKFLLHGSPKLFMSPMKRNRRDITIHMKLTQRFKKRLIPISEHSKLLIKNDAAWFHYSY